MTPSNNTTPAPAYFDEHVLMARSEIGKRLFVAVKKGIQLQSLNKRPLYPVLQFYWGNHRTSMADSIIFTELADFFFAANTKEQHT